ncbi:MAG TPA: nuclear transport factor 2 family protein, partial [Streptomyces sp.]|nr:nuclear transport factor 2 family protein [Streptomyces sp.]
MQAEHSQDAVDTFLAAFNASSPAYVTELLARALTLDVVFWGPLGRSAGVEAVENFITELRSHPEGPGTVTRT